MLREVGGGLRCRIRGLMHKYNPLLVARRHLFSWLGIVVQMDRLMLRVWLLLIRLPTDAADVTPA